MSSQEKRLEDLYAEKLFLAFFENGKSALRPVCEEFAMKVAERVLEDSTKGYVVDPVLINRMLELLVNELITAGTAGWRNIIITMWNAFHYSAIDQKTRMQGVHVSGADRRKV